ncbi:hypothetical protein KOR42_54010 [Thalassoglobus neptunius]|uniref:DUF4279 domain-containing protein n=1 Tax=Thalassoglobus neptunius TaxID=1938619 RepID=A0A5C5UZS4_9PLAN|nr:DUF4279 domain-containing protein [Thalassoglobus neptunius]TWT31339.1 hypothetical protein KOR42_54010 [Thalassoglobus neptunius]
MNSPAQPVLLGAYRRPFVKGGTISTPKIKAEFTLFSTHIHPDEITAAVGLQPTAVHLKGQQILTSKRVYRENQWVIGVPYRFQYCVEECLAELFAVIRTHKQIIVDYCEQHAIERQFACVIYMTGEAPDFVLSSESVQELADYGAVFDVDIILLSSA